MTIRVRFDITWTITRAPFEGKWFSTDEFISHAKSLLVRGFSGSNPDIRFQVNPIDARRDELRILWDVDLEATAGLFDDPAHHVRIIESHLPIRALGRDSQSLEIEVWRQADMAEAVDHGEINLRYAGKAAKEDFPVFRPEPHPDWEEADEVFVQEGCWFWCVSDEMAQHLPIGESAGPAVGPVPTAIFTPWEPGFLARHRAGARRAAELARLSRGVPA